jgi:hypothetical protein
MAPYAVIVENGLDIPLEIDRMFRWEPRGQPGEKQYRYNDVVSQLT